MDRDLRFLEADPEPVGMPEPAPEQVTVAEADVQRLMGIEGVEGVWTRQPPAGSPAVVVAISKDSARAKAPSSVGGLPVVFEFTGPIRALPSR